MYVFIMNSRYNPNSRVCSWIYSPFFRIPVGQRGCRHPRVCQDLHRVFLFSISPQIVQPSLFTSNHLYGCVCSCTSFTSPSFTISFLEELLRLLASSIVSLLRNKMAHDTG